MQYWELTLEMPCLPDMAAVGGNARHSHHMEWAKARRRAKDDWINLVRSQHMPPMPRYLKPEIEITLIYGQSRRRDLDNTTMALKPLMDALVFWNILIDDSPEFIAGGRPTISQEVDPDRAPLTVVEIKGDIFDDI